MADVGCGPGQVARYLHDRGRDVLGVDLSPAMVAQARGHHPGLTFEVGSLLDLGVADGAWSGVTAFYSILHLTRDELGQAARELHRVLCPDGLLLLAFHVGQVGHVGGEVRHLDEWWGRPVSLDFRLFPTDVVAAALEDAGFSVEGRLERVPYPREVDTRRAYLLARKVAGAR